jgi:hypothetical protein
MKAQEKLAAIKRAETEKASKKRLEQKRLEESKVELPPPLPPKPKRRYEAARKRAMREQLDILEENSKGPVISVGFKGLVRHRLSSQDILKWLDKLHSSANSSLSHEIKKGNSGAGEGFGGKGGDVSRERGNVEDGVWGRNEVEGGKYETSEEEKEHVDKKKRELYAAYESVRARLESVHYGFLGVC